MIIKERPGKFYFKALFQDLPLEPNPFREAWILSSDYFDSKEEAISFYGHDHVQWPAEQIGDGVIYVPTEEELNEA